MTVNRTGAAAIAGAGGRAAPLQAQDENRSGRSRSGLARRILPVAAIALGIAAFFAFDLDSYVTFDAIRQNREWLLAQVEANAVLSALAFIFVYAAIVAFSLPGATVLSITGGFLFGQWFGTAWNVIGATLGATMLFFAARTAFGDILHKKAGPWLHRLEAGFQENALSYLLVMRLVPLFPFFVVNLVPAFLGVKLRVFVLATFFGIIPGAFVYTSVGVGLGSVFDIGADFSAWDVLMTPEVVTPLAGLALLSLLPVFYKIWRARRG